MNNQSTQSTDNRAHLTINEPRFLFYGGHYSSLHRHVEITLFPCSLDFDLFIYFIEIFDYILADFHFQYLSNSDFADLYSRY